MKRLLVVLGVLVVALVGVALAAPSFIDWAQYKPQITKAAEDATGRKLLIEGDLSAQILPYPALTVEKVTFANAEGADEPTMAKLEALKVSVALIPLFSGEIVVSTVRLIGADILLEQYKDGTNNWTLGGAAEAEIPAEGEATAEAEVESGGSTPAITFEDVLISDTRIRYADHKAGTVEDVRIPELAIMVGSLQGPFRLTGQVIGRGLPLDIDVAVATLEPGRSIPLSAEIKNDEAGLRLLTDAAILGLEDEPRINGTVTLDVGDVGAMMALVSGTAAPKGKESLSLALKTSLRASAVAVTMTDTTLALGGEKLTGGLDVSLADPLSLDVRLKGGRIDLDKLMPKLMSLSGGAGAQAGAGGGGGATAGAEEPFDIPRDLTGAIDLSIEALTYNGETVRNATVKAAIGGGVVTLTKVGADLPAAAKLSVNGTLRARSGKPYFNGGLNANAPDMRAFLQFLGVDVSSIPEGKLKRYETSMDIVGGPENLNFSNINIGIDQMRLTGNAAVGLTGPRPSIQANLAMNALDADAYMPPPGTAGGSDKPKAKSPAGKKADGAAGGPFAALASADADIAVRVGSLTYNGSNYRDVTLGVDLANKADGTGALEASAKMGGLSGGVKANYISTAASLETAPLSVKLFFNATSATAIAKALGTADKAPPAHLDGPVSFTADIAGNAADASMTALLKTAQGNAKLNGNVKDAMGQPQFALALDAVAPAYRSFMASLGLGYGKAAPVGALTLTGKVRGTTQELVVDEIAFAAGENTFKGTMTIDMAPNLVRPQIDANLTAGTMNLDALMPKGSTTQNVKQQPAGPKAGSSGPPWSDEPLPLDGLKAADANVSLTAQTFLGFGVLFEQAKMRFVLKDGFASIEQFTGNLYGGPLDMKGSFGPQRTADGGTSSVPVLDMTFSLTQSNMATLVKTMTGRESITGLMDANFTLKGAGATSRTLVQSLNGSGSITGDKGAFVGFDVSALVKAVKNINDPGGFGSLLGAAFNGGQTNFNDLDFGFDIKNGVMTTKEARTDVDQAEMRLNAVIDLPRWYLDSRADLVLENNPNLPPVGMKFFGPLDQPQRKVDTDSLTRYAAEKAISAGIANLFGDKKKKQEPAPAPAPAPEQPAQQPAPDEPAAQEPAPEASQEPENGPLATQEVQQPAEQPAQQPAQQPKKKQKPDPAEVFQQLFGK